MLTIEMSNALYFNIADVPRGALRKMRRHFRIEDPAYFKNRKRGGKDNGDLSKYLNLYENTHDGKLAIPRGAMTYLTKILKDENIEYEIIDKRLLLPKVDIGDMKFTLRPYQVKASDKAVMMTQGVITAPCGSGKTIIGVDIVSRIKQPSLIVCPDTEICYQWTERLMEALGMEDVDIGMVGDGYDYVVGTVTVATVQSLYKRVHDEDFCNQFGLVIIDEAHMVAARTFREVMHAFKAKHKYGLTATPYRNDNLTDLIQYYCGLQIYEITDEMLDKAKLLIRPELYTKETKFFIPYNPRDGQMNNKYLKAMSEDPGRNKQICKDIINEVKDKRLCLVVAKRAEHCKNIKAMLEKMHPGIRVKDMSGSEYDYDSAVEARAGNVDVIVSVNRAVQGLDIKNLESLFMVAPRKAYGEIIQIIGRIQRPSTCNGKYKDPMDKVARIFDYNDVKMERGGKLAWEARMEIYEYKCINV